MFKAIKKFFNSLRLFKRVRLLENIASDLQARNLKQAAHIGKLREHLGLQDRAGRKSQRYDELERARKRRYKGAR